MTQLTAADLSALAERLAAIKRQAQAEIEAANNAMSSDHEAQGHEVVTRADEAEEFRLDEVRRAEIQIDQNTLVQIDAAQARMQAGQYGLCLQCGEAIARERLFALPTAIRCTPCQAEVEQHG